MNDDSDLQPKDDYHLRFQVAAPAFTEEQERQHAEGVALVRAALANGKSWSAAIRGLKLEDADFREVILTDCLKVIVAERHFQGGERLKGLAGELGVSMERLLSLKEEMIREVVDSSKEVYRLTRGHS
ncbi:MAG: hypothetical protein G8237_11655 [Magnetococcales bacterium]|nr:hypothetical protein [Magnetococcales bacterium]NGZ07000.1 hypothetical protein [Magnetococcales bacterium]